MAWAYLLVLCVLFSWQVKWHRVSVRVQDSYEVPNFPTALGDTRYYKPQGMGDFFAPNVVCINQPKGMFRRMHQPVHRDDARMMKVDPEASGEGPCVYFDSKPRLSREGTRLPSRYYLKTGENLYLEFGAQCFWPAYEAPRAIPYVPPG